MLFRFIGPANQNKLIASALFIPALLTVLCFGSPSFSAEPRSQAELKDWGWVAFLPDLAKDNDAFHKYRAKRPFLLLYENKELAEEKIVVVKAAAQDVYRDDRPTLYLSFENGQVLPDDGSNASVQSLKTQRANMQAVAERRLAKESLVSTWDYIDGRRYRGTSTGLPYGEDDDDDEKYCGLFLSGLVIDTRPWLPGEHIRKIEAEAEFSFVRVLPENGLVYIERTEACQSLPWRDMLVLNAVPETVQSMKYEDNFLIAGADWAVKITYDHLVKMNNDCSLIALPGGVYMISRCWVDKSGIPPGYEHLKVAANAFAKAMVQGAEVPAKNQ